MNIVLVAPRFPPSYDGVGDHAQHLAHALTQAGHRVVVVTDGGERPAHAYTVRALGAGWNTRATREACRVIASAAADLLLIEYTPFNFGASSMTPVVLPMMARARDIPVTTIVHEAFHAERAGIRSPAKRQFLRMRDRLVLSRAQVLCVSSEALRTCIFEELPSVHSRVVLVPIGANVEPGGHQHWQQPQPQGRARLATFGVVMPRRRIELQIRALAELVRRGRDAELHVLGRIFDDGYAQACRRLAAELGMTARVHLRGALPSNEISAELLRASVALHTAEEGAIPSSGALLGAMAHGLPIVAAATPHDLPPFTTCMLRAPGEPSALAAALEEVLAGGPDGAALGRRARMIYERHFSWSGIAERIVAHSYPERSDSYAASL